MITYKTRLTDLITEVKKIGGCREAVDMLEKIDKKHPMLTIGDVFPVLGKTEEYQESWLKIFIQKLGKNFDPEERKKVIGKMKNAHDAVYLLTDKTGCDFLTEEEHEMLRGHIKDKLPHIEKDIVKGNIKLSKPQKKTL